MSRAHVRRALRPRLWRRDSIVAPDVRLPLPLTVIVCFNYKGNKKTPLSASPRQSPWQLAFALNLNNIQNIAAGGEKGGESVFFSRTPSRFSSTALMCSFSAPTCSSQDPRRNTQHNNEHFLRAALSRPSYCFCTHTQILTPTHLRIRDSGTHDSLGSLISETRQMHKVVYCQGWCWRTDRQQYSDRISLLSNRWTHPSA